MSTPKVWNRRDPNCPKDAVNGSRSGPFGNPFKIGRDGDRTEVIAKYRAWLPTQPERIAHIKMQRGKDWWCWCAPLPCHCDVHLEVANA